MPYTPRSRRTICVAALLCALAVGQADAQDFRLTIGNPVAAIAPTSQGSPGAPPMKKILAGALFVVRVDGCPEPAKAQITATAEGIVNGVRRSESIALLATPTAGVYAVNRTNWPDGTWVVNLVAAYRDLNAGAVVPVVRNGFVRDASRFFPRPATPGEIDAALKAHVDRTRSK